jgi:hypothetical protein
MGEFPVGIRGTGPVDIYNPDVLLARGARGLPHVLPGSSPRGAMASSPGREQELAQGHPVLATPLPTSSTTTSLHSSKHQGVIVLKA